MGRESRRKLKAKKAPTLALPGRENTDRGGRLLWQEDKLTEGYLNLNAPLDKVLYNKNKSSSSNFTTEY